MEFNNEFYQKWRKKSTVNDKFFTDCENEKLLKNDKGVELAQSEHQTESDSFSLRLSESYVEETQESPKEKKLLETIVISDSSSDAVLFDEIPVKESKVIQNVHQESSDYINESSEDEAAKTPRRIVMKTVEKINSISKVSVKENKNKIVIEESDSDDEVEQNNTNMSKIIKETVAESIILSEKKKKEILNWLSTNFDNSKSDNSCSLESAIPESRKSGFSSGNSSLERLELNFETPNNREKFYKINGVKKINKKIQTEFDLDNTDKSNINSKRGQLEIEKNQTPSFENSSSTPINYVKAIRKKIILPESDSLNSSSPKSKNSTKSPIGNSNIFRRKVLTESDSSNSKTPCTDSAKKLLTDFNVNQNIVIPESDSFDSNDCLNLREKINDKNHKDPNDKMLQKLEVSNCLTNDESTNNSTSSVNNKENKCQTPLNKQKSRDTINDCADILENLYGADWRKKTATLISVTEPKKQTTKKIFKEIQTEKKNNFKKPQFIDQDIFVKNNKTAKTNDKKNLTEYKKSKNYPKDEDSFINDDTTSESSPDCSYYTALSNPVSSQKNHFNIDTSSTVRISDKNNKNKKLNICDSESDSENWKVRNNIKKLSFNSSESSNTSEFDPEDIVIPKKTVKNLKIKSIVNLEPVKDKVVKTMPIQKSFLASLSKDVSLDEADFKAMVFRIKYDTMKEELCKVLFKLFNENIFENKLPSDMPIEWSVRLPRTAGKCYNRQSTKAFGKTVRSSRIVLATKVLDSPDRLRDTLIHEMCHAATWIINNVSDGHGNFWKAWANKARQVFPDLPPISRCHNYSIQTKYTYKCITCGYSIGRHSKSLDLNRKRCGYCHGIFELLVNKVSKTGKITQKKSTSNVKEPSGFALYVKENYSSVKQNKPNVKHGEIMKILGQQFSSIKLTPKPDNKSNN